MAMLLPKEHPEQLMYFSRFTQPHQPHHHLCFVVSRAGLSAEGSTPVPSLTDNPQQMRVKIQPCFLIGALMVECSASICPRSQRKVSQNSMRQTFTEAENKHYPAYQSLPRTLPRLELCLKAAERTVSYTFSYVFTNVLLCICFPFCFSLLLMPWDSIFSSNLNT